MYSNSINCPSNEEILIHSLVDDIYKAESKINEINQNQNEYNENNPQQKEIKKLEGKKEKLQKSLTDISSSLLIYLSNNDTQIKVKQTTINDLNVQINQLKNKLSKFNPINFQSLILSKYILSNNLNEFLTKEQINEIIIDSKKSKTHESNILKYKKDIENQEMIKKNILSNIKELKEKENQIKELLKMTREEKLTLKEEIINLISQKESLEEILKFKKLNMRLIYDNINNNENNINNKIELFSYELVNLDVNKASNNLAEDIIEIIETNNNKENNNLINSNGINKDLDLINNNIQISVSNTYLYNIIKGELDNYYNMIKVKKNISPNLQVQELINSLSNSIINYFVSNINSYNYNKFSSNNIKEYLKYFFKSLNYDGVIENKLTFINKDYKFIKKERHKTLENLFLEITKFKNKLEDMDDRILDINSQIELFEKENDIDEKILKPNLTENELLYIEISTKGNSFMNEKNELLNEIINIENDSKKVKLESEQKTNETKKNVEKINEKIKELKNEIEVEKLRANQEIITLRKLIADKFNIIKTQLQIYKSKYGSNLTIYNRLVDSINLTIKSTYKPLFGFERKNNSYIESKSMQDYNILYSPRLRNFNQINPQFKSFISDNIVTLKGNNDINESNLNYNNNQSNYSINEYQKVQISNNYNNNNIKLKNKTPLSRSSHNIFVNNPNYENSIDKSHNETKYSINRINLSIDKTNPNNISSNRQRHKKEIQLNIPLLDYTYNNNLHNNKINNNIIYNNLNQSKYQDLNISKNNNKTFKKINYINEKNIHHNKTNSAYNPSTIYNLNHENNKIWLEEREKLGKVIRNLKEKISKTEKITHINNSLMNKLSPLTQITFCYYRLIKEPYHKFNPLSNISSNNINLEPYNFIKSTISLNKRLNNIKIVPATQLDYIEIKIENIENTIVTSMIKTIIEIHRSYRRFKINYKNGKLEDFIEKEFAKYEKLSKSDISKCALNKNFNFSILMNNNQRIEILLCSYEDFKMWINGVAFIIKNKNQILKNLRNKDELIEK